MDKLLVIDGYSMVFRAYYATAYTNVMRTSNGTAVNAIFAFSNMLNKVIDELQPKYVLVAFDKGKKNFRHEMFEAYKGTRKPAPEDLVVQFPIAREFLEAANIPFIELDGYEADDIVGSATRFYKDVEINVLTGDRDLLQLINDNTVVYLMKNGVSEMKRMDEAALWEDYSLKPLQIIDFKGLSGDTSDNIPGIPKVGEKTATKLLNDYGSVENVLDHADEIKGKLGENIRNNKDIALLSKKLATIFTGIELPYALDELELHMDTLGLLKFYQKYEMKSLAARLGEVKQEVVTHSYQSVAKLAVEADELAIYYDHEYTHKLYVCAGDNIFVVDEENIKESKELIENSKIITHDIKGQLHRFSALGIHLNTNCDDLMIEQFLVDTNLKNDLSSVLANNSHVDIVISDKTMKSDSEEENIQKFVNMIAEFKTVSDAFKKTITDYEMNSLYRDIEIPLAFVLFEMEETGVKVDRNVLEEIAEKTRATIEGLTTQIYFMAGREFNINSPKQLGEVLFDDLGLPSGKKRSTNVEVLEELRAISPIVDLILDYRKYSKLLSTYAEGLQKYIGEDGKIHTCYNQCLAQTGRLSSSDPNLQNISVRNEETKEIRRAFIPSVDGYILMSADYSQVELRMLAHCADCQPLKDAFIKNEDIHATTASKVFGVALENVSSEMRRHAKAVNFGIVYGISDFGLASQLGISKKEAKDFITKYYDAYPEIMTYMNQVVSDCEANGYVSTILNRRRYIVDIKSSHYMMKEAAKRAAMNAPIQGSAADLIKIAMIHVNEDLKKHNLKSKIILQVHDELILEVPADEIEIASKILKEDMENAMQLSVPLNADVNTGTDWYNTK